MATLNSLLFLFSTLAPNIQLPGNLPVTQVPPTWLEDSNQRYSPTGSPAFEGCPMDWSIPTYFKHPEDCSRFYQCDNGFAVLKRCPSGTLWNDDIKSCDHLWNVECKSRPVLSQIACGVGEALRCDSHCQKNCTNYHQDFPCPKVCVMGCVCIEPLIRAHDGSCIMPNECPAVPDTEDITETSDESDEIQCHSDEELSHFAHCERDCMNTAAGVVIICPGKGPLGCMCKYPKVRGPEGNCIMKTECPRVLRYPQESGDDDDDPEPSMTCPSNEEVSCFSHCQLNCTNFNKKFDCPMVCKTGCVCMPPFIRGPDGSCIMPEQCHDLQKTPQIPDYQCTEGCDDNDNNDRENENEVVRGPFGLIIEGGCPENEVFKKCGTACQKNCENYNEDVHCAAVCVSGCFCNYPMVRGPDGKCIYKEECPAKLREPAQRQIIPPTYDTLLLAMSSASDVCPQNEEYKECGTACQKNCRDYDKDIPCEFKCESGCFCKEPMIRGPTGKCIYKEECPRKSNIPRRSAIPTACLQEKLTGSCKADIPRYYFNQETGECERFIYGGCKGNDNNFNSKEDCEAVCIDYQCTEGCDDNDDKDRENENVVLRGPFDNMGKCEGENEVYKYISIQCPDDCDNYKDTLRSCKFIPSGPKCECKRGYVRGPNGNCIAPEQCPKSENNMGKCEGENEVYKYISIQCPDDCDNYKDTLRACKFIPSGPKCECKRGYIRGPNGNCIVPEQCPKPEIPRDCPENEEYKECGTACQKNCQNYNEDVPCVAVCVSGCFCKDPMVRGPDGNCIYKEECPAELKEPVLRQIVPPTYDTALWKKAMSSASEVCPQNEEYKECGTACQKNCRDYDKDIPCEFKCESGCFCKEPMIRGPTGKCIYKEECPRKSNIPRQPRRNFNLEFFPDVPKLKCGENEEFSFCAPMCPDDCSNYQEDRFCKRICMPGCKCVDGYVKGKDGTCIQKEECEKKIPEDCSDLEEYKKCGSYCETNCHNYNTTDFKCEDSRCRTGCFCKSDLVRSPEGKCIMTQDCPAQSQRFWSIPTPEIRKFLRSGSGRY